MTAIHCGKGKTLTLQLKNVKAFSKSHNELYMAILEGAALLNGNLIEQGRDPVLTLAFDR